MTVFKTRRSPYYQYDFQRSGRRYFGSTKCLKLEDAQAFEINKIGLAEQEINRLKLASTLPKHVVREPFGDGWRYFFIVPSKARKAGCPMHNESLGTIFEKAVQRAEDDLLPKFNAWRDQSRKRAEPAKDAAQVGGPPLVGVYLLILKGKVVYIGSSKNMPRRVGQHRNGSRPFDEAYYIATSEHERLRLEAVLIKAMMPQQNTQGKIRRLKIPDPAPDHSIPPQLYY